MVAKSRTDIQTEIDSLLADNVTGDISPSDERTVHETSKDSNLNLLESTTQTVAGLTNYAGGLQAAGVAVVPIANRVVVNVAADFPAATAGVRPLASNTQYYLGDDDVDIGTDRFSFGTNVSLKGAPGGSVLKSTNATDLFTGGDAAQFTIQTMSVQAPNARIFNVTDTTPSTIVSFIDSIIISCDSVGLFTGVGSANFLNSAMLSGNDGIEMSGFNGVISARQFQMISTSATFKAIDLGTATSPTIEFVDLSVTAPAGAFGISGLASSGNVTSGSVASVLSCEFLGGMTATENINIDDIRWNFLGNSGIPDTNPDALLSLTGNTTETVIAASSTDGSNAVLLAGTWVVERTSQYTGTTAGRATYDGERDIAVPVTIQATVESASGTNKDIAMYLSVNGTVVGSARSKAKVGTSDPRTLSVPWQINFSQTNFVEVMLENQSDTVNLIGTDAILRVR